MNILSYIRTARHLLPATTWLPAALVFLSLTLSCQKSPLDSPQDTPTDTQIPIEFGVADNWTKATIATEDVLKDPTNGGFKVWAWFQGSGDGGHMFTADGTKVTWQNNEWTYSPARYWINGTYDFFAVYPKDAATVKYENGAFEFDYDISNQVDLLVADRLDGDGDKTNGLENPLRYTYNGTTNPSPVDLTFQHALCQLEFKAKAKDIDLGDDEEGDEIDENVYIAILTGIEIYGVAKSATYTSLTGWNIEEATDYPSASQATYSIFKESTNLAKLDGKAIVYETGIMMIPQTITNEMFVRVSYQGGTPWEGYIPSEEWEAGKKYSYLLSIDQNAKITFEAPIVTDWVKSSGGSFIIDTSQSQN